MERLSDNAIEIIDELMTERLHYFSEYIPLIDAANRLAEYENLEEQGRLVILPYTLGTTVYYIHFDKCCNGKCYWFEDGKCIKEKFPEYCPKAVLEAKYDLTMYQNGTRVFLTHEEAEEALKND